MVNTKIRLIIFFAAKDGEALYSQQKSHRRNGITLIVNKRVQNAVLGYNLKNDRMISIHFQDKPVNITVIQVYAPTTNAEETEVEWFYEDLLLLLSHFSRVRLCATP